MLTPTTPFMQLNILKKSILLLLITFMPISIWANDKNVTSEKYFSLIGDADKAISEGNWLIAEQALQQAMRLEPGNPSNVLLMSNLGMIQFYDGRTDEALSTLTHAHNIAPKSVTVLMNRARIYTSTYQPKLAEADYSMVISLDSTLIEPRFYRAMLTLNSGNIEAAKTDVDTLVMMDSENRLTNIAQATLLMTQGDFNGAIPHLSKAIESMPDATYYSQRAFCHLQLNDLSAASEDIASGLELDPTDAELYVYRALLNKMRYRPDDAKIDAEKAIKFGADAERVKKLLDL